MDIKEIQFISKRNELEQTFLIWNLNTKAQNIYGCLPHQTEYTTKITFCFLYIVLNSSCPQANAFLYLVERVMVGLDEDEHLFGFLRTVPIIQRITLFRASCPQDVIAFLYEHRRYLEHSYILSVYSSRISFAL